MSNLPDLLRDLGEKAIIRQIVRPLFNPDGSLDSVGDDCAVIPIPAGTSLCASTDRVPADLVSFRLGIIDHKGLGYYLAVLNLSDVAAMGGRPIGLLLNLGLPANMRTVDFVALLDGVHQACEIYGCAVVGGDLSSSAELSISATSLGAVDPGLAIRRSGARIGDAVYCSDSIGNSATAFAYFLRAKPAGMLLPDDDENLLRDCFRRPRARFDLGPSLSGADLRATAMDNTDGVAQSLSEIAEAAHLAIDLNTSKLPVLDVSRRVADYLRTPLEEVVLGPGADFQLLGTIDPGAFEHPSLAGRISRIGSVVEGEGIRLVRPDGVREQFQVRGWDYYAPIEIEHVLSSYIVPS